MNEHPPSAGDGGSASPANDATAARDDASPDPASGHATDSDLDDSHAAAYAADAGYDEPFPWPPGEGESASAALVRTWRDVMFTPASFYRRMPPAAPLGGALVYFLIASVLGSGIQLFWDMLGLVLLPRPAADSALAILLPASPRDALISFFFAPVVVLCILFVGGAITHALLKLLGGAHERFGTTVRVFAYAQSPQLLVIVPFLGAVAGMFWAFVISIIGLREAHRTTTTKAALAILLPAFGIFFFLMLLIAVAVMGVALMSR